MPEQSTDEIDPALVVAEWAGRCYAPPGTDKVWSACCTSDGLYAARWGKRGGPYQSKVWRLTNRWAAELKYERTVDEKRSSGYLTVGFNARDGGNLPQWSAARAPVVMAPATSSIGRWAAAAAIVDGKPQSDMIMDEAGAWAYIAPGTRQRAALRSEQTSRPLMSEEVLSRMAELVGRADEYTMRREFNWEWSTPSELLAALVSSADVLRANGCSTSVDNQRLLLLEQRRLGIAYYQGLAGLADGTALLLWLGYDRQGRSRNVGSLWHIKPILAPGASERAWFAAAVGRSSFCGYVETDWMAAPDYLPPFGALLQGAPIQIIDAAAVGEVTRASGRDLGVLVGNLLTATGEALRRRRRL